MSANRVLFHRPANASKLTREPAARAVDAYARSVPRAATDLRDFAGVEPLPGDQREEFALVRPQPRKRGRGGAKTGVHPAGLALLWDIRLDALSQSFAPALGAMLVAHDAPRGPVEPESRGITNRT